MEIVLRCSHDGLTGLFTSRSGMTNSGNWRWCPTVLERDRSISQGREKGWCLRPRSRGCLPRGLRGKSWTLTGWRRSCRSAPPWGITPSCAMCGSSRPPPSLSSMTDESELHHTGGCTEIEDAFRLSTARCLSGRRRIGLLLSAGMDTRVNLAGAAHRASAIHTFTYGIQGCTDVVIAEKLSRDAGTSHHTLELEPDFLLRFAESLVWMTDGMLTGERFDSRMARGSEVLTSSFCTSPLT